MTKVTTNCNQSTETVVKKTHLLKVIGMFLKRVARGYR